MILAQSILINRTSPNVDYSFWGKLSSDKNYCKMTLNNAMDHLLNGGDVKLDFS